MAKKNLDFESAMRRLQDIVQKLEHPDLPLEKSVALYKEGCELVRCCRDMLDKAKHEISLCGDDGSLSPFTLLGEEEA